MAGCGIQNQPEPGSYEEAPQLKKKFSVFRIAVTPIHKSKPSDHGHQQALVSTLGSIWREYLTLVVLLLLNTCDALFIWGLSVCVPVSQLPETSNPGIRTVVETLHPFLICKHIFFFIFQQLGEFIPLSWLVAFFFIMLSDNLDDVFTRFFISTTVTLLVRRINCYFIHDHDTFPIPLYIINCFVYGVE